MGTSNSTTSLKEEEDNETHTSLLLKKEEEYPIDDNGNSFVISSFSIDKGIRYRQNNTTPNPSCSFLFNNQNKQFHDDILELYEYIQNYQESKAGKDSDCLLLSKIFNNENDNYLSINKRNSYENMLSFSSTPSKPLSYNELMTTSYNFFSPKSSHYNVTKIGLLRCGTSTDDIIYEEEEEEQFTIEMKLFNPENIDYKITNYYCQPTSTRDSNNTKNWNVIHFQEHLSINTDPLNKMLVFSCNNYWVRFTKKATLPFNRNYDPNAVHYYVNVGNVMCTI